MNIASAELLQRAAQGTTDALLKRREIDNQLQAALQGNMLKEQTERGAEARYNAQQQHWATTEQTQADAFKKQQDTAAKNQQLAEDEFKFDKVTKAATAAMTDLTDAFGQGAISAQKWIASGGKEGKDPKSIGAAAKSAFQNLSPEVQKEVAGRSPNLQDYFNGTADYSTMAQAYQQKQQSGGKGKQNIAVGIQYENEAKKFQDQLDDGQDDDESDKNWAKRQQTLQQAVDLNTQLAKTVAGLRPPETKTTTGTKSNPIPGLPPVTNSSTTATSFGGPTPAPNVPQKTIPPNTAPLPQAAPNPALPSATPSAGPAPGLPKPAAPLPNHVTYLQAHPETANMFDQQYGAGSAAKYLQPQPAAAQ